MRILYLAHRVPYPPNKGDKIRSYHHVRYLAERHELHVLAFFDQPEDEQWAAPLRAYCCQVVLVPLSRYGALARGVRALARGRSLSEGYFGCRAMREAIRRATAGQSFDVAWAYSSVMVQYLPGMRARWRVADYVDVDSDKWHQFASHLRGPMRWAYRLEASRLRTFEKRMSIAVDRVLLVSDAEAALLRALCPPETEMQVVPNGVDTEYFRTSGTAPSREPATILFTGALDYRPNVDAVVRFAREILPRVRREIPEARFVAVGHRPTASLLQEVKRQDSAFEIAGSVPDIRPYFSQARVYVAPLQLGRGVQNKILEAMAMHVPVVASPRAVEGLEVRPGEHVVVAGTESQFATAVVDLWRDAARRRCLVDAAFRLIQTRYRWQPNLELLDGCLPAAGGAPESETHLAACAI